MWQPDNSFMDLALVHKFEEEELISKRLVLEEKKIKKNRVSV